MTPIHVPRVILPMRSPSDSPTATTRPDDTPRDLRRFVRHVIRAGDLERSRVAHALHESTAQNLSAIVMQIGAMLRDEGDAGRREGLEAVRGLARETLEEVRLLSHTMYPRSLDDHGLAHALRHLAALGAPPGVRVEAEVAGGTDAILSRPVRSVLHWVAQEGLANALRHARPTTVVLRLEVAERHATLVVADDGTGFDPGEAEARRPGMGLVAMRERVALVGGELHIARGRPGTRVVAMVPLDPDLHDL